MLTVALFKKSVSLFFMNKALFRLQNTSNWFEKLMSEFPTLEILFIKGNYLYLWRVFTRVEGEEEEEVAVDPLYIPLTTNPKVQYMMYDN